MPINRTYLILDKFGLVGWGCIISRPHLCKGVRLPQRVSCGPVGWCCRKSRPHLCRRVRLSQRVSCGPVGWCCRKSRPHLCIGVRLSQRVSCGPVGWCCRKSRPHLCRGVRLSQRVSWYDTKQSDSESPVMQELWGMWSTLSLSLLPGPTLACSGSTW